MTEKIVKILKEKADGVILLLLIVCTSIVSFSVAVVGIKAGLLIIGVILSLLIAFISFISEKSGFFFILIYTSFMPMMDRVINVSLPTGLLIDMVLASCALGIVIRRRDEMIRPGPIFKNPVNVIIAIWIIYHLLQVANPYGSLSGWINGVRGIFIFFLSYFVLFQILKDLKTIKTFTKIWLSIAVLAALYAFYQQIFGLPGFDYRWVTADEIRIGLNYINGNWRKWSFLSDSATFGMFMAISSVFCILLGIGPFKTYRYILITVGILMIVAMVFSGTRTAYVMVPIAFSIFALMTLNNIRTVVVSLVFFMVLLVLFFGPFYSGTFSRIRSAFEPNEDPSMMVREENRAQIQPYIYSHPFGGGINTSGVNGLKFKPSHPLAGFPPDSDYLETALELGWIGLIFQICLNSVVMIIGIKNFYLCKNTQVKYLYLAYIAAFFALTIGGFAKKAVDQFPLGFISGATYVIFPRMIKLTESRLNKG